MLRRRRCTVGVSPSFSLSKELAHDSLSQSSHAAPPNEWPMTCWSEISRPAPSMPTPYHVDKFTQHFQQPAEQLGPEQIREYQLHLIRNKKVGWSSFNQAVCGLRFLYRFTIPRDWHIKMIPFGKRPKKLPLVLGQEDASRLIQCTRNQKHRTVLLTLYAAGLRLSEATHLKVEDIDSSRMQLRVMHGKGAKQRLVPMSPRLLTALRELLAGVSSADLSVSRQDSRRAAQFDDGAEGLQGVSSRSRAFAQHLAAHFASQFRDGIVGSGSRSADDRTVAGPLQLHHDDGLLARSQAAPELDAQSPRLAAGSPMSRLATAGNGSTAEGQEEGSPRSKQLTVANLLRQYTPAFVERHVRQAVPQVQSTLAKLSLCRTAALGSRWLHCPSCDHRCVVYNSCGDRHCPQCRGTKASGMA